MTQSIRLDREPFPAWAAFIFGLIATRVSSDSIGILFLAFVPDPMQLNLTLFFPCTSIVSGLAGTVVAMLFGLRHIGWLLLMIATPYVLIIIMVASSGLSIFIPLGLIVSMPLWLNQFLGMGLAVIFFKWRDYVRTAG